MILRIRGDLEEEFAVILKYQEVKQQKEQEKAARMQTIAHDSFGATRTTQKGLFTEKKKKSVNYVRLASATRYPQNHYESIARKRRATIEIDKAGTQSGGCISLQKDDESETKSSQKV